MYTGIDRTGFGWLLACAALAAGEFAASRIPQAADAWPVAAALIPLVALFGFGFGARGWHLACIFLAGAVLYLHASVDMERMLRGQPWMRDRFERRFKTGERGMAARLASAKEALSRCAGIGIERGDAAILNRAILLGERRGLPKQAKRVFAASGAMHVFAVSGVHVMAVAKVLAVLMQLLFVPKRLAGAAAIPFVWGYVCVIGMPPSAVRAAMMATIYFFAPVFWRRSSAAMSWALTFMVVYVINPRMITDIGCALSFTVMLSIILAGDSLRGRSGATALLVVTLVAWAAGVPLSAHVFGHVTPGGILANLVLIPAAALTVGSGALGMLAGFVSETAAAHLNNLAALGSSAMAGVSAVVAKLPFADFEVEAWPISMCAAWYAALLLALLLSAIRRARSRVV